MSEFQDKIKKYFENQKQFEWFTAWVAVAEKETERTTGVLSQSLRQSIEEADLSWTVLCGALNATRQSMSSPANLKVSNSLKEMSNEPKGNVDRDVYTSR